MPDPLMYTNLGNLAFWVLWLMGIVVLVPLVGRAWCSVCPVGAMNEFTSRFGLKKIFPRFIRNQHPKGSGTATGSWDPVGPWQFDGGRIYSTALLTMCLQAYYRFERTSR